MLTYCQFDPKENISVVFFWNLNVFIQEKTPQSIFSEMVAIVSEPQCVNPKEFKQHWLVMKAI